MSLDWRRKRRLERLGGSAEWRTCGKLGVPMFEVQQCGMWIPFEGSQRLIQLS